MNRENEKINDRKCKCFFVPKEVIVANGYDLSINKYKKIEYIEENYKHPLDILERMEELESEIMSGIKELEGMIR